MRHRRRRPQTTVLIEGAKTPALERVLTCYNGSDAQATISLYVDLEKRAGNRGKIAVNLIRAQKASIRAKAYRGGNENGSFKQQAYKRKNWSLNQLACALALAADEAGIIWGWQKDPEQTYHKMVLYVDLPGFGQASFHTRDRGSGPTYPGAWDGKRGETAGRILRFAASLLAETAEGAC